MNPGIRITIAVLIVIMAMVFQAGPASGDEFPGWMAGQWETPPDALLRSPWPYRSQVYEVLFPDRALLGRTIYGLAIYAGDVDGTMDRERFEGGVQGFHYSLDQVIGWANETLWNRKQFLPEEKDLLNHLVQDGVLVKQGGLFAQAGNIKHILGAAPGRRRTIDLNLTHERIHVLWELDPDFRARLTQRWQSLTEEEKEAVYSRLSGYNRENTVLIIEEWAVRETEANPPWSR